MASSFSSWRVIVSVHSPFWRVFEKNGFPHCSWISPVCNIVEIRGEFVEIKLVRVESLGFKPVTFCFKTSLGLEGFQQMASCSDKMASNQMMSAVLHVFYDIVVLNV